MRNALALPNYVVFAGTTIKPGETTAQFPIQKLCWKDGVYKTGSYIFRYEAVPFEARWKSTDALAMTPQSSPRTK